MRVEDMPLAPGAVVGYGVNRHHFEPRSEAMSELLNEILAMVKIKEPPTDEELAVILHAEALGLGFSTLADGSLWQETEEERAGFFKDIDEAIAEAYRRGARPNHND